MSLKLFYKDEVFRSSVRFEDVTFALVKKKILVKFPHLNWNTIKLYWTDSAGDNVTIADDDDVEELKINSVDKVLNITIKAVDTLVDVKCGKAIKSENIKNESPTIELNRSSSTRGRRINTVADIIENSTIIGERGKSDKGETSSCNLKIENEPLQANIASCVSHKKPQKRSILKPNVIIPRLETGRIKYSSSSNAKKSKVVEKAVACDNVADRSQKKIVNVDKSSSVVAKDYSLSSNRNSSSNKKLNAPKLQKVGNGTIGTGNVSSGEKNTVVCERLNGDKIMSNDQCRLCDVVVKHINHAKRHHVETVHLKNKGVDWLYQCVACGHRSICLKQIQNHARFCCSKPKTPYANQKKYFLNKAFANRIADIFRSAFPSDTFHFFFDANRVAKCTFCSRNVNRGRKLHSLQHIEEATDVTWLYKCLLCEQYEAVYRQAVQNHVKKVHKLQSFRIGAEYTEIDSVGDVINRSVALCFPVA